MITPFSNTIARISGPLGVLSTKTRVRVLLFTKRPEYFDTTDLFDQHGIVELVKFSDSENSLETCAEQFDLALVCTHILGEHKPQYIIRKQRLAPLIVVWNWDNHHCWGRNLSANSLADIILPAHSHASDVLKTPHAVLGRCVPLGTSQWSRALTSKLLWSPHSRSDALSGGHVLWPDASRNEILRILKDRIPGNNLRLIDHDNRKIYFSLSAETRFREWTKHKVSLVVPLAHDLSMRAFDALIAGQVPIVPTDCCDLDAVIPPDIQDALPVVRISDLSPETVETAWRIAIAKFDEGGDKGISARHEYARDHHHIKHRINAIVEYLKSLSQKNFSIVSTDDCIGLVAENRAA